MRVASPTERVVGVAASTSTSKWSHGVSSARVGLSNLRRRQLRTRVETPDGRYRFQPSSSKAKANEFDADADVDATLRRVMDPSASPLRVLGVELDEGAIGMDASALRSAYRRAMRDAHPDAPKGSTEAALRVQRAYESAVKTLSGDGTIAATLRREGGLSTEDPFSATSLALEFDGAERVFVDETRCVGDANCSSSCVRAAPKSFYTASDTGAARWIERDGSSSNVDETAVRDEWLASQRCPRSCIYYVTERQRSYLAELLRGAIEGETSIDDIGPLISELLAKAEYENGRAAGARSAAPRSPTSSTRWVDWY